jgi:hypothetical protein
MGTKTTTKPFSPKQVGVGYLWTLKLDTKTYMKINIYQFIAFFVNNNLNAAARAGINIARITPNVWSTIPATICEKHYNRPAEYCTYIIIM